MDRNTIIGFSLIFLILIGFYFYTKPTAAQMGAQQKTADSLALVEKTTEEKKIDTAVAAVSNTSTQNCWNR